MAWTLDKPGRGILQRTLPDSSRRGTWTGEGGRSQPPGITRPRSRPSTGAIDRTGRKIIFSTSPGETPVPRRRVRCAERNQWRISDDLGQLEGAPGTIHPLPITGIHPAPDIFRRGHAAARHALTWANASRGSRAKQYTMMTLWSIFRSPLIMGGDLTKLDVHETLLANPRSHCSEPEQQHGQPAIVPAR